MVEAKIKSIIDPSVELFQSLKKLAQCIKEGDEVFEEIHKGHARQWALEVLNSLDNLETE